MEESIERAAKDLVNSSYAVGLTEAGISTGSGMPDFRRQMEFGQKIQKLGRYEKQIKSLFHTMITL